MTKLKNIYHTSGILRSLAFFSVLALFVSAPAMAQNAQNAQNQNQDMIQERLQKLQAELQGLNAEIYEVQNKANRSPEVQKALMNYNKVLTEEMKKIDPENKSLIDQRKETYEKLLNLNAGEMTPEKESQLQEVGEQFNSIRQQLAQTEAQANQTEKAAAAMEAYNQVVLKKMTAMDPQIEGKIEEREEIGKEFTDLRNAIIQQQ